MKVLFLLLLAETSWWIRPRRRHNNKRPIPLPQPFRHAVSSRNISLCLSSCCFSCYCCCCCCFSTTNHLSVIFRTFALVLRRFTSVLGVSSVFLVTRLSLVDQVSYCFFYPPIRFLLLPVLSSKPGLQWNLSLFGPSLNLVYFQDLKFCSVFDWIVAFDHHPWVHAPSMFMGWME